MNKSAFIQNAQTLPVTIAGQPLVATPKQFSTGSVGFFVNGKVPVTLPGGERIVLQVSGNFTAIGSKEWQP